MVHRVICILLKRKKNKMGEERKKGRGETTLEKKKEMSPLTIAFDSCSRWSMAVGIRKGDEDG